MDQKKIIVWTVDVFTWHLLQDHCSAQGKSESEKEKTNFHFHRHHHHHCHHHRQHHRHHRHCHHCHYNGLWKGRQFKPESGQLAEQ